VKILIGGQEFDFEGDIQVLPEKEVDRGRAAPMYVDDLPPQEHCFTQQFVQGANDGKGETVHGVSSRSIPLLME
jgi:hypothetical protein